MRRLNTLTPMLLVALTAFVPSVASAGGLDSFLDNVDVRARVDIGTFKTDLSVTFGVSSNKVDAMFEFMSASDVYMCLRIGEVAHQPVDRVISKYKNHRGQGWGVIAKSLGIKPGSAEFHALKADRLGSGDRRAALDKPGKPHKRGKPRK